MSLLPVFLKLEDRACLVVGAGEIAAGKIEGLVKAQAQVTVVAPNARPEIMLLAEQNRIAWRRREFLDSDIDGAFLIIAGTNLASVNQHVYRLAAAHNILCNAVDNPPHCHFYYGSVVSRGDLQIAISTAGESPAVAQRLRHEIDEIVPRDLGPWLSRLGALRREVLEAYSAGDERKHLLHQLGRLPVCEAEECPARRLAFPNSHAATGRPFVTGTSTYRGRPGELRGAHDSIW
jgi:precorrin-2 dehydrogenase/sirohydrochlorin ferrochelatase